MRMRGEYPSPIEQAASPETEAAFQSRLFTLLSTPGLKLRRIAALLDAESYLVLEKSRKGSVLRFDVKRYAGDQRTTGRFAKLPDAYRPTQGVILPPGEGEIRSGEGKEPYREAEVIHRTKAVMDLLGDMKEPYDLVDGTTTSDMVRKLSYVAFVLKKRGKLLLVNDEEGNATYVVHHLQGEEEAQEYLQSRKDDLRDLMRHDPGLVSVLEFRSDMEAYVEEMRELIERPYAREPAREGRVTQAPAETKEILAGTEEEVVLPAPEGWMMVWNLKKFLDKSQNWIDRHMRELAPVYGRDVKTYLDASNRPRMYYSPEIVRRLKELAQEHEPAPEEWMTVYELARMFGKSRTWVQPRIIQLAPVEGRDARTYLDTSNKPGIHYSPEVVRRLQELAREHEPAPDGWLTNGRLRQMLQRSETWIIHRLEELAPVEGRDVRIYLDITNKPGTHYSPEIVRRLQGLAREHEPAPEGWMTVSDLLKLGKSQGWITSRLQEMGVTKGHDEKAYLDQRGRPAFHYSPEVVRRLEELAQEHEPATEGWMTAKGLTRVLQKSQNWIQRRIDELVPIEGEEVRKYLDASGHTNFHYSPRFIERLRELAQTHEQAPEGWMTAWGLGRILNKSDRWVQPRLRRLHLVEGRDRQTYLDVMNRPTHHYSPNVVERLKKMTEE